MVVPIHEKSVSWSANCVWPALLSYHWNHWKIRTCPPYCCPDENSRFWSFTHLQSWCQCSPELIQGYISLMWKGVTGVLTHLFPKQKQKSFAFNPWLPKMHNVLWDPSIFPDSLLISWGSVVAHKSFLLHLRHAKHQINILSKCFLIERYSL